jgi:hypothetical protein
MAKLHFVASLARQSRHVFRLVPRHKFRDLLRNVVALFIERVFPEQTRQHRAPQFALRVDPLRHRSLVRLRRKHPLPHIHLRHRRLPPF